MRGNNIDIVMPDYPDIVPTHPDWIDGDFEKVIAEEQHKVKDLTEWPDI